MIWRIIAIVALLAILPGAMIWNIPVTTAVSIQVPGPSQALYNAPYYTCSTNRYVSTTGSDSNNGTASDNAHAWLTIAHADTVTPSAGWCINVANGSYANGATFTHGGNSAASNGYVVYRCQTLNGCTITDTGCCGLDSLSAFGVEASYVIIDGFILNGGNGTGVNTVGIKSCQDTLCGFTTTPTTTPLHHIWAINNIVSGYGEAGITFSNGDFFYSIHNTIFNNAHDCQQAQGSGISYYLPIALSPYTPTAGDKNNTVTGNTGTLYRQFIMWNVLYNNYVGCTPGTPTNSDGNGIIADDWQGDQFGSSTTADVYTKGGLLAFNVSYNNGGGGIHIFTSAYVTAANNSAYNNYLDPHLGPNTARGGIDDSGSYAGSYVNNISYSICGSGQLAFNSSMGVYGNNTVSSTTLGAAIVSTGATTITTASAAGMPGGTTWGGTTTFQAFNGDYTLPGGNMIQIDNEVMRVTAGWGTTTLTVVRGYNGTTAATHANGATVDWIQGFYSNNVTKQTGTCSSPEVDLQVTTANLFYCGVTGTVCTTPQNKEATSPGWVNVGNTSAGSESTQPVGTNFALSGGSAAIGYGTTASPFNFLPAQAVDVGACANSLTQCP